MTEKDKAVGEINIPELGEKVMKYYHDLVQAQLLMMRPLGHFPFL